MASQFTVNLGKLCRPAGMAALVCVALVAAEASQPTLRSGQDAPWVAKVVERCVEEMVLRTCIANKQSAGSSPTGQGAVFVAGVGAVDAKAFWEIRAAGEAMCDVVRRACTQAPNASQCQTARSLWAP